MKKVLGIIAVFILIGVVIVGLQVMSLVKDGGDSSSSSFHATEEEIETISPQLESDILAGEVYVDGTIYQFPIQVQALFDAGWVFKEGVQEQIATLTPNTVTNTTHMDKTDAPDKLLSVTLINPSEEKQPIENVYVASFSAQRLSANKVILPQGLTWKSTVEEVKTAYGEPTKESVNDLGSIQRTFLTYSDEVISIKFTFDAENGEAPEMASLSYSLNY